jgi:hypothetical protein
VVGVWVGVEEQGAWMNRRLVPVDGLSAQRTRYCCSSVTTCNLCLHAGCGVAGLPAHRAALQGVCHCQVLIGHVTGQQLGDRHQVTPVLGVIEPAVGC